MAEKEARGRKAVGTAKKKKKVYKTSRLIGHTILKAMPEIQKTPFVDLARGKILELVRLDIDTSFTEDDFNVFKEDVMKCKTAEKLIEFLFNTILETEGMGENLKND